MEKPNKKLFGKTVNDLVGRLEFSSWIEMLFGPVSLTVERLLEIFGRRNCTSVVIFMVVAR